MIVAIFAYNTSPGERDDFVKAAGDCGLLDGAPAEKGCISYQYYLPIDDPGKTVCVERWENVEAFVAHRDMPHTVRFQDVKAKYVVSTDPPLIFEATEANL